MKNYSKEFDIKELLEFFKEKKYEKTVACFKVIDKIDKIKIPKSINNWKVSLKSLYAVSNKLVTYDYVTEEQKSKYIEEQNELLKKNETVFLENKSPENINIEKKDSVKKEV